MSNPIDEFLEFDKEANWRQFLRGVGRGVREAGNPMLEHAWNPQTRRAIEQGISVGQDLRSGAVQGLGGMAIAGAGIAVKKIHDAVMKRRDFNAMLEAAPDLREVQEAHPETFNSVYSSFRQINPSYASNPHVASSQMRLFMEEPANSGRLMAASVKQPNAPQEGRLGFGVETKAGPFRLKKDF